MRASAPGALWLAGRWFVIGALRQQWRYAAIAAIAVALGVALALAIQLVNGSALDEFHSALDRINGEAELQIEGRGGDFDEAWYPRVSRVPGVESVSPLVRAEVALAASGERLTVLGIDVFRAAQVTPALIPSAQGAAGGAATPLLADDSIFLPEPLLREFGLAPGDRLEVLVGVSPVSLRIAGTVDAGAGRIAVMDIGAAQWRTGRVGLLSRLDLRLAPGASRGEVGDALRALLAPALEVIEPGQQRKRMSNVSRAYRVNLSVLALVALFTGGFLVFTTLALSVVRQRPQLALLMVLGARRRWVAATVIAHGLIVSALGSIAGVGAGIGLGWLLLRVVGGDLGGGYFSSATPALEVPPLVACGYGLLGIGVGLLASLAPARGATRMPAVEVLRSGTATAMQSWSLAGAFALLAAAAGALLLLVPPVGGVPVAAYLAIAAWLLAGILAVPAITRLVFARIAAVGWTRAWRHPPLWLALARTLQAPGETAAAIAGVVASFALAAAMATMINSFRDSVSDWLDRVLPADLYARAPAATPQGAFDVELQSRIAAVDGVARVEFARTRKLSLHADRPPATLIVRQVDAAAPGRRLPLTGAPSAAPAGRVPVYVSEAMVDLYGWAPGREVWLPLEPAGARLQGATTAASPATAVPPHRATPTASFHVAGVWRDYARQHGSVVIDRADYLRLTGDSGANELAVWLTPGAEAQPVFERLVRDLPPLARLEFRSAAELRSLSLRIFDRSFRVTYALEAAAIVIGLFGIAASYGGQAITRRREFAILRHIGLTRAALSLELATEGAVAATIGAIWGGTVGVALSLVLIFRVNPQSFHWTMDFVLPWPLLAATAATLAAVAALTALLAAREVTGRSALDAVREDW